MAHPEEVKAAVMAALLAGQGALEVAREYKLPHQTVYEWKKEQDSGKLGTKKARIGALLMDYLETNLETLRIQSRFFQREDWLAQQEASQAAVLHGVIADKSIRLLEALQPDNGDSGEAPEPPIQEQPRSLAP